MPTIKYIAIAAVSIDGKIARHKKENTTWTSKEDKKFLHKKLDECNVIILGNTTYKLARKALAKRNCLVFSRSLRGLRKLNENITFFNPAGIDLKNWLSKQNYQRVCILGGRQIYSYFLKRNLIDEIYLTVEPIIFGRGLEMFDTKISPKKFKLISFKKLNTRGSILLFYKKYSSQIRQRLI